MPSRRFRIRSKHPDELIELLHAIGKYTGAQIDCHTEVAIETEDPRTAHLIGRFLSIEMPEVKTLPEPAKFPTPLIESESYPTETPPLQIRPAVEITHKRRGRPPGRKNG